MATITRAKTFLYKKARLHTKRHRKFDLSDALKTAALQKLTQAQDRRYQHGPDSEDVHALSELAHHGQFVSGLIIDYTVGQPKSIAEIAKASNTIPLRATKAGQGEEWVDTIAYFGAQKNHVVLAQTTALKSPQIEIYVNWLLRRAGIIADEEMVYLEDHPPPSDDKVVNSENIRSLTLTSPLISETELSSAHVAPPGAGSSRELSSLIIKPKSNGIDALNALIGDILGKQWTYDSLQDASLIDVELKLKFAKTSRGKSSNLLAKVAHQMRHVDQELDYSIDLKKGGSITKNQMKVQNPFRIPVVDNQLSIAAIRKAMLDWLEELIKSGRILD